ncbi:GntR family transcriptional regulator [Arthrobacter sp. 7Tela_A1]|uniref:GntR family transcriptional regulator n=1 Tax=Arthrobacter sp. 7Tela_A1 TaxID=3093745 RepID=UPI003BB66C1D
MNAHISVDLASPVPPYEQIRGQVSALAASGILSPGDRLPTIRMLAADLGVAPGTVARAYKELEAEGTVTALRRRGTVITGEAPGRAADADAIAGTPELTSAVEHLVRVARQHALSDAALLQVLNRALRTGTPDNPGTTLEQ